MARRKLPKRPTAAALRVGHTVYVATVDFSMALTAPPVAAVYAYRLTSGPALRREGEVLPERLPLATMRDRLRWCERFAVPPRLFWTRRQAQRAAEKVLRDYLRWAC